MEFDNEPTRKWRSILHPYGMILLPEMRSDFSLLAIMKINDVIEYK